MSKQNNSFWDTMRKLLRGKPVINNPRYPKSWQPQTDYNPVPPGSDRHGEIDMRPKAVEQREKEARRSLFLPIVLVAAVVLIFTTAILARPQSLGNFIGTARDGSHINFTFIDSVELPQSNGVIYNSIVIELNTTAGEAAADELFDVLNSIKCRKRIQMPFWEPELYKTGKDNISITFVSDDAKVDLSFLSGNITIYDIGTKNRSFKVSDYEEAFNSLAEVARKYGTEHAAR